MSTVYFHDLNKSVDIPDDYNEDAINDIHDSLAKEISNGTQQPDTANNILQKAASAIANNPVTQFNNPILSASYKNPDILPILGQIAGGSVAGFPGAVGGETIGDVERSGLNSLKNNTSPDFSQVPLDTAVTAAFEGVPRAVFNTYFGKQIATKTMQGLGEAVGKVKTALASDPTAMTASQPIIDGLQKIYDGIKPPLQAGAKHISDWIDYLKQSPTVHASDLQQMEDSFGAYSDYGSVKEGAYQPPKSSEPVINRATKAARNIVSDAHDTIAVNKGFTDFPNDSAEFSKLKSRWYDINPARDKIGLFGKIGPAILAERIGGIPAMIGTYLGEDLLTNPLIKNAAFKGLSNPIVNAAMTGGRAAGTQETKDLLNG